MKLLFTLLLLLPLTAGRTSAAAPGDAPAFPAVAGWRLAPPPGDSVYTPDNLWDIIDGAAEVFLSYGFVDLRIGEYTDASGTDVRVELYRHSSNDNAFGMYSQERNPDYHFIDIGTQGYVEEGVLNYFCGIYYVKISSHAAGKTGVDAMEFIGRQVARHLNQQSAWPAALSRFPAEKKVDNSEGRLAENFLGYKFFRSAFTARYEGDCTLFTMDFDSPALARSAADAYAKVAGLPHELPEGEMTDMSDPHNGPVTMLLIGKTLAGAFGPVEKSAAHHYLELLRARLPAGK